MRPADEPLYTSEHPAPYARDARWLSRRARNVARRPLVLLLLTAGAFFVALLAIITAPLGQERVRPPRAERLSPPADTASAARAVARERARLAGATTALDDARRAALAERPSAVVIDTFSAVSRARRDSLSARSSALSAAMRRAIDAPLPASFRALAELREFAGDSAMRQLADSVAAVERAREEAEAAGAADTVFIAMTSRVTQLGDSLVRSADARLSQIRRELSVLAPEVREVPPPNPVDTVPFRVALDSSQRGLASAEARLAAARAHNDSLALLASRPSDGGERAAAPATLIVAAGVIGLALGFLFALAGEIRRPTIADAREAEAAAGVPVLAHLRREVAPRGRTRRRADRDVPPLIELTSDRYARLYHRLADVVSRLPRLAVLGDHPAVVATVSANLATAAAHTARATLLLDTDFETRAVAAVMRVRATPGIAEVLAKRLHWSSAVVGAIVGRNRSVDVLPAGTMKGGGSLASAADSFAAEVSHIGRRYDTVIISAPLSRRGAVSAVAVAVPDAIVCVRTRRTSVRVLQRIIDEARRDGARIRGLVLWDRDEPRPAGIAGTPASVEEESTLEIVRV